MDGRQLSCKSESRNGRKGKAAIVTVEDQGLGAATAGHWQKAGAKVTLLDINLAQAEKSRGGKSAAAIACGFNAAAARTALAESARSLRARILITGYATRSPRCLGGRALI